MASYDGNSKGYVAARPGAGRRPTPATAAPDPMAALMQTLGQGQQYSNIGMAMQMMQLAQRMMMNPNSTPQQMEMAREFERRAQEMMQTPQQPAMPFGINYLTGQANGPFAGGNSQDKYKDDILSKMSPDFWGPMQAAASPQNAAIYQNSDNSMAAAKNYLEQMDRQYRAPATFMSDPVTGARKEMIWSPDQQALTNQRESYVNNLPAWAKPELGVK